MKLVTLLLLGGCLSLVQAQNPYVFFSPQAVVLSADAGTGTKVSAPVRMITTGPGFNFSVQGNQGWMAVAPTGGTIAAGGTFDMVVTCNPSMMQTGTYTGKITITPEASSGQLPASIDVSLSVQGVAILLNPSSLDLTLGPGSSTTTTFYVSSSDTLGREVVVTPYTSDGSNWLLVTSPAPIMSPMTVGIRVNSSNFDVGAVLNGELRVTSPSLPGVMGVLPIKVTIVDSPPGFTVVPSQLTFYAYGSIAAPPQPVQVVANAGRVTYFDVTQVVPYAPLSLSISRGTTPSTFSVLMDTLATVQLPREDSMLITPTDSTPVVQVPIRTQLEPAQVYSLPQVADGGDFKTSITLVNNATTPAYVTVKFYKSDPTTHATTPWNPAMENNAKVENVVIPVNGSWSVQTAGTDPVTSSGWAEVQCRESISGVAVYRQSRPDGRFQEAAVPLNSTPMQRSLLPFDNSNGFVTSMAIVNVSASEVAKVRVAFRDEQGRILKVDRLPDLPTRGHYAFSLSSLWPYLADKRGTADFWITTGQISLLGLRFNPTGAFTSFETQTFNRYTRGRRSLPQIADGGDSATSFRTTITLVNNDAAQANVNLKFWREAGNNSTVAWPLTFLNNVDPSSIVIPPGAAVTLETAGASPTVQSGWAEIISGQWVTGFAVFKQIVPNRADQEAAVPINVGTSNIVTMPFDNADAFTTTLALANISASETSTVNLTFRNLQGQRIVQVQLPPVPPNGHAAFRLIDLNSAVNGQKGSLEISKTTGEVSVMGLRFAGEAYTSFKAVKVQ